MKILTIIAFLSISLIANDSFYTKTTKTRTLLSNTHGVKNALKSPKKYKVYHIMTDGAYQQIDIANNIFYTAKLPNVIEWRIDNHKNIIGFIVRTYDIENPSKSILNIVKLNGSKSKVLGTTSRNKTARKMIDNY